MHRPVCRGSPADVVVSETLRPSFRFASITIGGVLADQLGIAAINHVSDSPLIAAGPARLPLSGRRRRRYAGRPRGCAGCSTVWPA